jgi:hypothetical protein
MAKDKKSEESVAVVEVQERPQTVAPTTDNSVEGFITEAIKQKLPIESMKEFLAMRKEVRADQAREAFTQAMAQFQADCPVIAKTKEVRNKSGQVTYRYAPLDSIILQVKDVLGKNHLAYDFSEERDKEAGTVTVTCTVTHSMGHTKSSSFTVEVGEEAYMTDTQKYGARNTFAKRYAFMNVFGIATGDEDTDARELGKKAPKLPPDPKAKIVALMRQLGESDPTTMKDKVVEFTQLDPNDPTNVEEIVERLSIMLEEKNENN